MCFGSSLPLASFQNKDEVDTLMDFVHKRRKREPGEKKSNDLQIDKIKTTQTSLAF